MADFQNHSLGGLTKGLTIPGFVSVATTVARDAIPAPRRKAGMLVYVVSDNTHYKLNNTLDVWTVF